MREKDWLDESGNDWLMELDRESDTDLLYRKMIEHVVDQSTILNDKAEVLQKIRSDIAVPTRVRHRKTQFIKDQLAAILTLNQLEQETLNAFEALVEKL
jgi:hypothetical protein